LISRPDRVQVWASRLWANDFPPVCVMSGRPAETWRKFKFATPPGWAYLLLLLVCAGGVGFIAYAIAIAAVAERASGYLPMTRSSSRTVTLAFWVPTGLLVACVVTWAMAAIIGWSSTDPNISTLGGVSFGVGFLLLAGGLAGRLIIAPFLRPRGKVKAVAPGQTDRLVELRNVHPNFVAALNQVYQANAAQRAAMRAPASGPPLSPGSI
jgi:hypothetical protein